MAPLWNIFHFECDILGRLPKNKDVLVPMFNWFWFQNLKWHHNYQTVEASGHNAAMVTMYPVKSTFYGIYLIICFD